MPSTLSVNLRERVIAAIEAGASRRGAAQRFGVGAASAIRWDTESPVKRGCPRGRADAARQDWFERQPDLDPDRLNRSGFPGDSGS